MRLAVTGAAGFVGSHVVRRAVARGHQVLAWVRHQGRTGRLRGLDDRVEICDTALDDAANVRQAVVGFRPDAIVHCAWYANPADYLSSCQNLASLETSVAFSRAAFEAGCRRLVGTGTCLEYGSSSECHREDDLLDPISLYASCKLAAYYVARGLAVSSGADILWARLFHVHGPDEHPERLLPRVIRSLRSGQAVDLTPGEQVRDQLHVEDVASGLCALAEFGTSGAYNVCSGRSVTLRELLSLVAELAGRPDLLRFGTRSYSPDQQMCLRGDPQRLMRLGWRPASIDLRHDLARILAEVS